MAAKSAYDERFVHFVVLFNVDRDYFECHEVMEELWLEEGRNPLYQGLLQAAVGLHHWRNDNYSGAVKLFDQAENKLVQYPDNMMGLDLAQLRADIKRSVEPLRRWVEHCKAIDRQEREADLDVEEQTNGPSHVMEPNNTSSAGHAIEAVLGETKPPLFCSFDIVVADRSLRELALALAEVPLEIRLHGEDHEG
ncbi:DUF309 domain-containing protein [Paenibacillus solisilvae]|uniref:DUF309 domain-containing protein n=1 Tax=Paenibacillus solisilvae TaxID=2486751 RepID=A0ABW0W7K0_9BACL